MRWSLAWCENSVPLSRVMVLRKAGGSGLRRAMRARAVGAAVLFLGLVAQRMREFLSWRARTDWPGFENNMKSDSQLPRALRSSTSYGL